MGRDKNSADRLALSQEEKQSIASCSPCVVLADRGKEANEGKSSLSLHNYRKFSGQSQ